LNAKNVENAFDWPLDIMKHRFIDVTKVAFQDVQKAVYELSGSFAYLKHHLRDFVRRLCDSQEAENDFAWPFDIMKHRFNGFIKVVF
jgi:hypothetical protein